MAASRRFTVTSRVTGNVVPRIVRSPSISSRRELRELSLGPENGSWVPTRPHHAVSPDDAIARIENNLRLKGGGRKPIHCYPACAQDALS